MNSNIEWRKVCLGVMVMLALVLTGWHVAPTVNAQDKDTAAAEAAKKAKQAPDFELEDLDGKAIRLNSFRGQRPVLIYFWATWCPYCMEVRPLVAQMRNSVDASFLEVLGVNVGGRDTVEKLKRFQVAHPSPYPILFDGNGMVSQAYGVRGIPYFVVVDKAGEIVYRNNAPPMDLKKYIQ